MNKEHCTIFIKESIIHLSFDKWIFFDEKLLGREDDHPSVIFTNGCKVWFKDGYRHRENAPAMTNPKGALIETWWYEGLIHREDGPSQTYRDGTEMWYKLNKLHNTNGPAVARKEFREWWLYDVQKTFKEWFLETDKTKNDLAIYLIDTSQAIREQAEEIGKDIL